MKKINQHESIWGMVFGVLSAIFVSGYVTTNKYIYTHYNISAFEYTLIFAMAGALYATVSLSFQINEKNIQLVKQNYKSLLVVSLAGVTAVGTFVVGQHYTTALNASLLMPTTIVTTAFFSHIFLKEKYIMQQLAWIIALFFGIYLAVVGLRSVHLRSGDLIILGSVLFFGFGNGYSRVVMRKMGGANLVPDVRLAIGGAIAICASVFVLHNGSVITRLLPFALLAGLFYWLTMKSFARAVYLINANHTVVLNNAQIFFSSLAGVLLLTEHYSIEKLIGSIIAITAIYFIAGKKY